MKAINTTAINAVFELVDNQSTSFTEKLFALGVCTRAIARPLAVQWAATKYTVKARPGQRGMTLPRGSAAEQAVKRVLDTCFPQAEQVSAKPAKPAKASKADPVTSLLQKYAALTGAEKRRFMMSLGK
jgi:hypothetical protein